MRYLFKHKKEFAITVGGFVMAVIALINACKARELNEDVIITVVFTALAVLGWFFNQPTSKENSEMTDEMRLIKKKEDLPEDYWEDLEDEEEDEGIGLTEDEMATEEIDDGVNDDGGDDNGERNS